MTSSLGVRPRRSQTQRRRSKALLILGFGALVVGNLTAYLSPATGYEVSIYTATPIPFWVGVAAAVCIAAFVSLDTFDDPLLRTVTLGLGGLAVAAVVGLPLLRSYYFYGMSDSLTHLGIVKEILAGVRNPVDLLYPGTHLYSAFVSELAGIQAAHSMQLVLFTFVLLFLLFVPLSAHLVVRDSRVTVVAAFSAFLLLPINNVGFHMMYFPYTMTTFFFTFIVYLFINHVTGDAEDDALGGVTSAAGLILPLTSVAIVFFHPQVAVNVIILFVTVSLVQAVHSRMNGEREYRRIHGQTIVLIGVFLWWATQDPRFWLTLDQLLTSVVETAMGTGAAGQSVSNSGQSLQDAGGTLTEMFLKLFLLKGVYVALSLGLVVYKVFGLISDDQPDTDTIVTYFTFSGLTLGPFFLMHYVGGISEGYYFFRHVGFAMVLVTLVGAIAIYTWLSAFEPRIPSVPVRGVLAVGAVAVVLTSLAVAYPSPYIYKHNHHVSDAQLDGYETLVEHVDDITVVGVRKGPNRYSDALTDHGVVASGDAIPADVMATNVTTHYQDPRLIVVTEVDYEREVVGYNEIAYSSGDFRSLRTNPGVSQVATNGEFNLYYVPGESETNETTKLTAPKRGSLAVGP